MAQETRAELKAKWVTGYVPTQTDFENLFDSIFNYLTDLASITGIIKSEGGGISEAVKMTDYVSPFGIAQAVAWLPNHLYAVGDIFYALEEGLITSYNIVHTSFTSDATYNLTGKETANSYMWYLQNLPGLNLDQTSPQTIENGAPIFKEGLSLRDGLITRLLNFNSHDMTMQIKANDDVTLQVNQEQVIPVINLTGGQLLEGFFCRLSSYDVASGYPTIILSSNVDEASAFVDGMLTQTLEDGESGLLTCKGFVRDLDTTAGLTNDLVYLGVNGVPTPVKPTYPAKVVVCGKYEEIHATTGKYFIDVSSSAQTIINDINTEIGLKAAQNVGICAMRPILVNDIVIDTTLLTLTIATIKGGQTISASNPIVFYIDGSGVIEKFTKTTAQTASFANTTGTWYFYFDATGTLVSSLVRWSDFNIIAPVFVLDWDSALVGSARLIEEQIEMHLNTISSDAHAHMHFNDGTINIDSTGILIRNELTTGSPNADGRNTVVSLSSITNMDDNLMYTITNCYPNAAAAYFEQNLGIQTAGSLTALNSGLFPIRINNVSGQRSFLPATRFPFAWDTGTNRPEYITATGVRTLVADDRYFVYYLYSLQDRKIGQAVRLVSAQVDFTTIALAQAHSIETLQGLYADLRNPEIRPLYKLIFFANNGAPGAFDVAVKYTRLHEIVDLRKTKGVTSTASAGSMPATNVTELTDGNVQTALNNLRLNAIIYEPLTQPAINTGVLTLDCLEYKQAKFEPRKSVGTLSIDEDFEFIFSNITNTDFIQISLSLTGTRIISFPSDVICANESTSGVWSSGTQELTLSTVTSEIVELSLSRYKSTSNWILNVSEKAS